MASTPGMAPPQPNTFADGSVLHPTSSFPLGGYGIWHPGRRPQDIHQDEFSYAQVCKLGPIIDQAGVALAGASLEPFTSSTRKEVCVPFFAALLSQDPFT